MPAEITAEIIFPRDPNLYVRDHKRFLRAALEAAARFHHKHHIPRHFEHFAWAKYGYKKRVAKLQISERSAKRRGLRAATYQALKDKLGLPPLVSPTDHSGATKRAVTGHAEFPATPKGAKVVMRLPFKGGTGRFKLKAGRTTLTDQQKVVLQIHKEIQAISEDETRTLTRIIREHYLDAANDPEVKRFKKVRFGPV